MEKDTVDYYKSILSRTQVTTLESTSNGDVYLSDARAQEIAERSRQDLHRIVNEYLGGDKHLHKIADELAESSDAGLKFIRDPSNVPANVGASLEAIVVADGSRPSFLIQNDRIAYGSSAGDGALIGDVVGNETTLNNVIQCVGRIDIGESNYAGTGFLVHKNFIVTNRHVLQGIATQKKHQWIFGEGAIIDFGREHDAQSSVNPRRLARVVFCPEKLIDLTQPKLDHSRLDLVVIELEAATTDKIPNTVLDININPNWAKIASTVFVIGYPGDPGDAYSKNLLEKLFKLTFGCKRLAPGKVMVRPDGIPDWTIAHDSTTLWGNSGSCIISIERTGATAGLHYGGNIHRNWGHIFAGVLNGKDGVTKVTLKNFLTDLGIGFTVV